MKPAIIPPLTINHYTINFSNVFTLLFLCLFPCILQAQGLKVLNNNLTPLPTATEVQALLEKMATKWPQSARPDLERELDFGYRQQYYTVRMEVYQYDLMLLLRGDSIVYGMLSGQDGFRQRRMDFRKDEFKLVQYLNRHNQLYRSDWTVKEMMKEWRTQRVFSLSCGFDGQQIPEEARKLYEYVEKEKDRPLINWLVSVDPELQTYGALGLLELKRKGVNLPDAVWELIDHLRQRNSVINTCTGCIMGIPQSFNVLLEQL